MSSAEFAQNVLNVNMLYLAVINLLEVIYFDLVLYLIVIYD